MYEVDTSTIHCFRAHRTGMSGIRLIRYNSWLPCKGRKSRYLNFITGVSGVIYPPLYLKYLKRQGKAFSQSCPHGDDMWLSVNALRSALEVAQTGNMNGCIPTIPGSQQGRLHDMNALSGLKQWQLRKTCSGADLLALHGFGAAESI
jgi:hypothetical protein